MCVKLQCSANNCCCWLLLFSPITPFFFKIFLLESWNVRYYSLEDGRSICLECMESAIMDTGDCQPLYHAIRDYYEGMNMKLDQQIPMLLVERQALNEAIVGEKNVTWNLALCFTLLFVEWLWFNFVISRDIITCLRQRVCVSMKSRQSPVYVNRANYMVLLFEWDKSDYSTTIR